MQPVSWIVGIGILIAAAVFDRSTEKTERPGMARFAVFAVIAVLSIAAIKLLFPAASSSAAVTGVCIGLAASLFASVAPRPCQNGAGSLALAMLTASAAIAIGGKSVNVMSIGVAAGAGLAGFGLGGKVLRNAVAIAIVGLALCLATECDSAQLVESGVLIFTGGVALLALGLSFVPPQSKATKVILPAVAGVIAACIGWWVMTKFVGLASGGIAMLLTAASGVCVWWMLDSTTEISPFTVMVSAVIWLGVATVSFGMAHLTGLTLACLLAASLLLALKGRTSLLSVGVFLAVLLQKDLHVVAPGTKDLFDISEHYGLIGLAIGAFIPLCLASWLQSLSKLPTARVVVGGMILAAIGVSIPYFVGLLVSEQGLTGFVVGIGFSSIIAALQKENQMFTFSTAIGLGGAAILQALLFADQVEMTRDAKIKLFVPVAISWAVAAVVLGALGLGRAQQADSGLRPEAAS